MNDLEVFFKKSTNDRFYRQQHPATWFLERFPTLGSWLLSRHFLKPWARVSPAQATDGEKIYSFDIEGISIKATVAGQGPLLILVHGWSGGSSQFETLRRRLVGAGYTVALFDAPAHGSAGGRRSHLFQFVEIIGLLVAQLGTPRALVGHSLGGLAAGLAASRVGGSCKLILLAPVPSFAFVLDQYQAALGFGDELRAAMSYRIERQIGFNGNEVDLGRALADHGPALIVHDTQDRRVPADFSRQLSASSPKAEYVETHGLGHKHLLDSPVVGDCLLEFLSRHERTAD